MVPAPWLRSRNVKHLSRREVVDWMREENLPKVQTNSPIACEVRAHIKNTWHFTWNQPMTFFNRWKYFSLALAISLISIGTNLLSTFQLHCMFLASLSLLLYLEFYPSPILHNDYFPITYSTDHFLIKSLIFIYSLLYFTASNTYFS